MPAALKAWISSSFGRALVEDDSGYHVLIEGGAGELRPLDSVTFGNVFGLTSDLARVLHPNLAIENIQKILDDECRTQRALTVLLVGLDPHFSSGLRRQAFAAIDSLLLDEEISAAVDRGFLRVPFPVDATVSEVPSQGPSRELIDRARAFTLMREAIRKAWIEGATSHQRTESARKGGEKWLSVVWNESTKAGVETALANSLLERSRRAFERWLRELNRSEVVQDFATFRLLRGWAYQCIVEWLMMETKDERRQSYLRDWLESFAKAPNPRKAQQDVLELLSRHNKSDPRAEELWTKVVGSLELVAAQMKVFDPASWTGNFRNRMPVWYPHALLKSLHRQGATELVEDWASTIREWKIDPTWQDEETIELHSAYLQFTLGFLGSGI